MFLAQSLNFPSEKRLKSTGFSEAGRILSIRPDKDTNEIWARCGHDGQNPLSIALFFSLSWNQSGPRYSFECGWLTVWMFAGLWCWEEMCSVRHSQHTIKGSFVSLWTKYRVCPPTTRCGWLLVKAGTHDLWEKMVNSHYGFCKKNPRRNRIPCWGGMQPSVSANREMHHLAPFISFEAI